MADIGALLSPKAVAVIGASPDETKLRGWLSRVILSHPFTGKLFAVSRSHENVMGMPAFPTVADIPVKIDLALIAIPSEHVSDELERCGKAGVKAAVVFTSGFSEQAGEGGKEMQAQLRRIAALYDMAVIGPNSLGFTNTSNALAATFSPAMNAPEKPLLPQWHEQGRIAVIAQSGAIGFSFYDSGRLKELPFHYIITTGNEACLETFDFVDHLLDEDKTDIFILFLEDVKNTETFRRAAEKALRHGKPIIATKLGQSEASGRATASHTGALAGDYKIYKAMLDYYGIIEGTDTEHMVDMANGFLTNLHRLPKGNRIGVCSGSGGAGGWMADACTAEGLDIPELDPAARARIDKHLPPYGTSQNPVDGTAQAAHEIGYAEMSRLVATANNVDGVIMVTTARKKDGYENERENFFRVGRETKKPILSWSYTKPHETSSNLFAQAGFPLHTNMRNCARTMSAMVHYEAHRQQFLASSDEIPGLVPDAVRKEVTETLHRTTMPLCEFEARQLLAKYQIGLAVLSPATSAKEACQQASTFDGQVALKIQSPDILHKTEVNGVALGLNRTEEIEAAYTRMIRQAKATHPGADIKGILVDPMSADGIELILGVTNDPKFGPMLMLGLGGIHAELLNDVAIAPVPIGNQAAHGMITSLKAAEILHGFRGAPASDLAALAELISRLSLFASDHAETISEIDLNPIIVHPAGDGVTVVDALIIQKS